MPPITCTGFSSHTSIKKQHEKPYPRWYAPSCCSTLSSHYSVLLVHPLRCTFNLYPYTISSIKDTKKGHPVGCPQYDESNLSYVGIIQIRLWVKAIAYSQPTLVSTPLWLHYMRIIGNRQFFLLHRLYNDVITRV